MSGIPAASMREHQAAAVVADVKADWRKYAACAGRSEAMEYYPDTALAICEYCPVRRACRTWVLGLPDAADPGAICGGMDEYQRKSYRRRLTYLAKKRAAQAAKEPAHG
jgi:hypothetical protein